MYPQYAQRGEIAIWLLITVGALLIPIIAIAICCIRRHLTRRPQINLMANHSLRMMMNTKRAEALRSYNGPYTESGYEDGSVLSEKNISLNLSRTSSLRKQHVHWPDGTTVKTDESSSIKKPPWSDDNILTTTTLTESPSSHRRSAHTSLAIKHLIETAIIPAGSTIPTTDISQFLNLSKEIASIPTENNYIV
ncbi:hypothetical protein I4U23_014546 [Adineta vaga]|nr:hypothetical protein I4U23_014546 [Adineta vaga]